MQKNRLFSLIDKAVFDYHLIERNDRILVGASGGKDSTALIMTRHLITESVICTLILLPEVKT